MAEGSKEEAAQVGGVDLRASSVAEPVCGGSEKFELDLAGPGELSHMQWCAHMCIS